MREKLVRSDLVECVIGIGKNLFYNSPMPACIVICRTKKPDTHKGHVLFIDAVNEVTRKSAESVKRQITIGSNDKLIFYDLSFVTTD